MKQPYLTAVLLVGVLLAGSLFTVKLRSMNWPDNHQGYAPEQPIAFSHRLHADQLQINCRYCHSTAWESRHAGIPSGDVCMRCHSFVTAPQNVMQAEFNLANKENREPKRVVSSELKKLYDAMGLDEELNPLPHKQPRSIEWVRVHNLPDYAYFDHRAHVAAGVSCQRCHGPVESMQRVEQFSNLSMGWCVDCHRNAAGHGFQIQGSQASLDCAACHY